MTAIFYKMTKIVSKVVESLEAVKVQKDYERRSKQRAYLCGNSYTFPKGQDGQNINDWLYYRKYQHLWKDD